MKFSSLLCTSRIESSSRPSSSSASPYPADSDSDSDSISDRPGPHHYEHRQIRFSAMSSWHLSNFYTTTQPPIGHSLEQDLRNRARAAALADLKSNLESLSIQLQAEVNALAHLQDRARKALDAVTAALVPYKDQEEKVDSVYLSEKWAIEEVKRRLSLQEAYDAAAALMNAKEKLVRMRRTRAECLRRELVDLEAWVGGDREDGGMDEDEAEVEMEEVEEGRAMMGVMAEDRPAFSVEKGQSAARKRFHSFGQTRPPLVRRHAAVPWSVSWDM